MSPASVRNRNNHTSNKSTEPDPAGEIVTRCRNGERKAQYELYQRYKDRAFSIAFRMAKNQPDAEDMTQKIFVKVFRKINTFRGDAAFSTWFYRLAVNTCLNHIKTVNRRRERFSQDASDLESTTLASKGRFDLRPYLERAIRALPKGYRAVFVLYDVEGYNHKEIGQILNISEGTSKSQLHKARKELRTLLEPVLQLHKSL